MQAYLLLYLNKYQILKFFVVFFDAVQQKTVDDYVLTDYTSLNQFAAMQHIKRKLYYVYTIN